jgi:pimeloyl-ACP methyl ester carboxylesterase
VLGTLSGLFLLWAHVAYWQWRFAPADSPDELHWAKTADGWRVQVRRYLPRGGGPRFREPVILCHGLGANHYNVDWDPPYGIAQYLAEQGRDCWVISLRGHDGSDRPTRRNGLRWGFGFDAFLEQDVPAAIDLVLAKTGAERMQWVGHSMGGMLAYALGGTPFEAKLAGGVVAVGSPPTFTGGRRDLRLLTSLGVLLAGRTRVPQRWATRVIAPFTGYFDPPFSEIAVAPKSMEGAIVRRMQAWAFEDISAGVTRQFRDWVHNDAFRSLDRRVDYRERMAAYSVPVLVVGGTHDKMAPPSCIESAGRWLGSADKTVVILGKAHGSPVDYGHGDLLLGKAAPAEVYPLVEAWLRDRATPEGVPRRGMGAQAGGGAQGESEA